MMKRMKLQHILRVLRAVPDDSDGRVPVAGHLADRGVRGDPPADRSGCPLLPHRARGSYLPPYQHDWLTVLGQHNSQCHLPYQLGCCKFRALSLESTMFSKKLVDIPSNQGAIC